MSTVTVAQELLTALNDAIAERDAKIKRLEREDYANHIELSRLRDLILTLQQRKDAPVDAMRRYMAASMYDVRANHVVSAEQFDADNVDICTWLDGINTAGARQSEAADGEQ